MAFMDGIRNGFPRYFMYKPSRGIDWGTLLQYKAQKEAAKNKAAGKAADDFMKNIDDNLLKDVNGTIALSRDVAEMKFQANDAVNAAKNDLYNAFRVAGGDASDPNVQRAMAEYRNAKKINAQAVMADKQAQEATDYFNQVKTQMIQNQIINAPAVVDYSDPLLGFGNAGANPYSDITGNKGLVGYKTIAGGEKVPVPLQKRVKKDGKYDVVPNDEVEGIMSAADLANFYDKYVGIKKDALGRPYAPKFYNMTLFKQGEGWNELKKQVNTAMNGILNKDYKQSGGRLYNFEDTVGNEYIQAVSDNIDAYKNVVRTAFNSLTDSGKAQVLSDYGNDAWNNVAFRIPSNIARDIFGGKGYEEGGHVDIYVKDLTPEEYTAIKVANFAKPLQKSQVNFIKTRSATEKSLVDLAYRKGMNIFEAAFDPTFVKAHGKKISFSTYGYDPEGKMHQTVEGGFMANAGMTFANEANKRLGISSSSSNRLSSLPNLSTTNLTNTPVLTPWGTILDTSKAGEAKIMGATGRVAMLPVYSSNPMGKGGSQYHAYKYDSNGNLVIDLSADDSYEWGKGAKEGKYMEVRVAMMGKDLKKSLPVVDYDEREFKKAIIEHSKDEAFKPLQDKIRRLDELNTRLVELKESEGGGTFTSTKEGITGWDFENSSWSPNKKKRNDVSLTKSSVGDIQKEIGNIQKEIDEISEEIKSKAFSDPEMRKAVERIMPEMKILPLGESKKSISSSSVGEMPIGRYYGQIKKLETHTTGGKEGGLTYVNAIGEPVDKVKDDEWYVINTWAPVSTLDLYDQNTSKENALRNMFYKQTTAEDEMSTINRALLMQMGGGGL